MRKKKVEKEFFVQCINDNPLGVRIFFRAKPEGTRMSIPKRISFEEVSASAHTVWLNESIADSVALDASKIINQICKRKHLFFNGKSSKFIVGGLFYLLGFRHNAVKKQRELADQLGTNDVTIRAAYRQLLKEFPDLFLDIMGKFARDDSLRFFVFLDLKQNALQSRKSH